MTHFVSRLRIARQHGALRGAVEVALAYLEGTSVYNRDLLLWILRRALNHDGSPDYFNRNPYPYTSNTQQESP